MIPHIDVPEQLRAAGLLFSGDVIQGKICDICHGTSELPTGSHDGTLDTLEERQTVFLIPHTSSSLLCGPGGPDSDLKNRFSDALSGSSSWSINACEDEKPSGSISPEKKSIHNFARLYSLNGLGDDFSQLNNLGDHLYENPMEALVDIAFEYPVIIPIEPVTSEDDFVFCDKPFADVPVDCASSSRDSFVLEVLPSDEDLYVDDCSSANLDGFSDTDTLSDVYPSTKRTRYIRRALPKVARYETRECPLQPPVVPRRKVYTLPAVMFKGFTRGLFRKR